MSQDVLLGAGHLHSLDGAKGFGDKADNPPRGPPALLAIDVDAIIGKARTDHNQD